MSEYDRYPGRLETDEPKPAQHRVISVADKPARG